MRWLVGWNGIRPTDGGVSLPRPVGGRLLWPGPDPLWAVGDWRPDEIRLVTVHRRSPHRPVEDSVTTGFPDSSPLHAAEDPSVVARLAVLGRCGAADAELRAALLATSGGAMRHLTLWPGSYAVVVRRGPRVTVLGDLAGVQQVFHTPWLDGTAYATAALPLADLTGAPVDPLHLAATLALPDSPEASGDSTPFLGVRRVPPGRALNARSGAAGVDAYEPPLRHADSSPSDAATTAEVTRALLAALRLRVRTAGSAGGAEALGAPPESAFAPGGFAGLGGEWSTTMVPSDESVYLTHVHPQPVDNVMAPHTPEPAPAPAPSAATAPGSAPGPGPVGGTVPGSVAAAARPAPPVRPRVAHHPDWADTLFGTAPPTREHQRPPEAHELPTPDSSGPHPADPPTPDGATADEPTSDRSTADQWPDAVARPALSVDLSGGTASGALALLLAAIPGAAQLPHPAAESDGPTSPRADAGHAQAGTDTPGTATVRHPVHGGFAEERWGDPRSSRTLHLGPPPPPGAAAGPGLPPPRSGAVRGSWVRERGTTGQQGPTLLALTYTDAVAAGTEPLNPAREAELLRAVALAEHPRLRHTVLPGGADALPYADLLADPLAGPLTDEPGPALVNAVRERTRLAAAGADHIGGHGARHVLDGHPARLADLLLTGRRTPLLRPVAALARADSAAQPLRGAVGTPMAVVRAARRLARTPYPDGLADTADRLMELALRADGSGPYGAGPYGTGPQGALGGGPGEGSGTGPAGGASGASSAGSDHGDRYRPDALPASTGEASVDALAWCGIGPAAAWLAPHALAAVAARLRTAAERPARPGEQPGARRARLALLRRGREFRVLAQVVESAPGNRAQRLHAPFLDNQVVRAGRQLSAAARIQPGARPALLRSVLAGAGVAEVPPGWGNGVPPDPYTAAESVRAGLRQSRPQWEELFARPVLGALGVIRPDAVREALRAAADGAPTPLDALADVVSVELWLRRLRARTGTAWTSRPAPRRALT